MASNSDRLDCVLSIFIEQLKDPSMEELLLSNLDSYISDHIQKTTTSRKIAELLDMQHEIDPTFSRDHEFLELSLKFLKAVYKKTFPRGKYNDFFVKYIFGENMADGFEEMLRSLVIFVINRPEEFSDKDSQSFWQAFTPVVREAILLNDVRIKSSEDNFLNKFDLDARFWLLKAEIFVQELLLSCSTIFIPFMGPQAKYLEKEMKRLTAQYQCGHSHEQPENLKRNLAFIRKVAKKIRIFYWSYYKEEITLSRARDSFSSLLFEIVLFKAESSSADLLKSSASLMALRDNQIETVIKELKFYRAVVTDLPLDKTEDVALIYTDLKAVARRITALYYCFQANKFTDKMLEEIVSDWLDQMKATRASLKEMGPQLPSYDFPNTNILGFIDFLLGNLWEVLKRNADSIAPVKHKIEDIRLDLEFLRNFPVNILEMDTESRDLKGIGTQVKDVAYKVGYIVDSIEGGLGILWKQILWLHDLHEEIQLIKLQATQALEQRTSNARIHEANQILGPKISKLTTPNTNEVVLVLSDQEERLLDKLTNGSSQRDIVSVVGMPGLGKTTLAKKVYNDPKATNYFHIRAWCNVSQEYEKRRLLLDILSDVGGFTDDFHRKTDEQLEERLRQNLLRRRYLIVMDDLWNIKAWKDLERSFPDDGMGSRILVTSRIHDLALTAKSNVHPLRQLSDDESWELLQMKIFPKRGCPKELLQFGKNIALNCKGLPLAIVAIAGLLERAEKDRDWWENIADTLSRRIMDDPETRCNEILQMSYNQLPDHLKACYLYFGAFLEDTDIPVRKLMWLWISEGFIRKTELQRFEDLAENYLMDLINRSLVIVSKRRSNGKVKACRVHDLLRDLCSSKAKEENFLQSVLRSDEPYASFEKLDYGANLDYYSPSTSLAYENHRLCICVKRKYFALSRPSGQSTRSLIFFATNDLDPRCQYDISFVSSNFKLLRILDLESINMGNSIPAGILSMVQLMYLAVSGDLDAIPPSIANLWRLETFLVKGLKGKIVLPETIWNMERLRHVHVSKHVVFNLPDGNFRNPSQLHNLVTLSLPSISHGKVTEEIISRFPNLRNLKCIFLESWDSSRNCNLFPRLDVLTQVESLKILYAGRFVNSGELVLPRNLKELTLSNFCLPWNHISPIGSLQNLEVLKLLSRAFEGQIWDMMEGEFPKLKFLKLDTLDIVQWNVSDDPFPNLQQLILCSCKDLKEVPYAFAEITTLQMIQVQRCAKSAEESARKLQEEKIEGLTIIVNNSDLYLSKFDTVEYPE